MDQIPLRRVTIQGSWPPVPLWYEHRLQSLLEVECPIGNAIVYPHIVKLMVLLTNPMWISLLLLGSAKAKSLYLDILLLPADKPVWIYPPTADLLFWKILRNEKSRP